jgi:hypothetical protein
MPFGGVYTELAEVLRMTRMDCGCSVSFCLSVDLAKIAKVSQRSAKDFTFYNLQFTLYNL